MEIQQKRPITERGDRIYRLFHLIKNHQIGGDLHSHTLIERSVFEKGVDFVFVREFMRHNIQNIQQMTVKRLQILIIGSIHK